MKHSGGKMNTTRTQDVMSSFRGILFLSQQVHMKGRQTKARVKYGLMGSDLGYSKNSKDVTGTEEQEVFERKGLSKSFYSNKAWNNGNNS